MSLCALCVSVVISPFPAIRLEKRPALSHNTPVMIRALFVVALTLLQTPSQSQSDAERAIRQQQEIARQQQELPRRPRRLTGWLRTRCFARYPFRPSASANVRNSLKPSLNSALQRRNIEKGSGWAETSANPSRLSKNSSNR